MKAHPLFPLIIEDYKVYLRTVVHNRVSFQAFSDRYHVNIKCLSQWMRRHGLSVSLLRYEALLEQGVIHLCEDPLHIHERLRQHRKIEKAKSDCSVPVPDQIKGVTVNFPDGIIVSIRLTDARSLSALMESYNKLSRRSHVQPE
jgi:hypothetical protein